MEKQDKIKRIAEDFLMKKFYTILQEVQLKGYSIIEQDSQRVSVKFDDGRITEYNAFEVESKLVEAFLTKNGLTMEKSKARPFSYTISPKPNQLFFGQTISLANVR